MPLLARISEEARTGEARIAPRRTLSLQVSTFASEATAAALIHNVSEHGLRIETDAALSIDEIIRVELPEFGQVDAKVVWVGESFAGCRFLAPVPKAAVSAALLRSPARNTARSDEWRAELPLIGIQRAQGPELGEWEFEQRDDSSALTFIALLVSFLVSAGFILALLKIALPN